MMSFWELKYFFNPNLKNYSPPPPPDSGRIVCKTCIFNNSNLSSYKSCKQNKKISNITLTLISSKIPTSFREWVWFYLPPPQNEPLKGPPRLGLRYWSFRLTEINSSMVTFASFSPKRFLLTCPRQNYR